MSHKVFVKSITHNFVINVIRITYPNGLNCILYYLNTTDVLDMCRVPLQENTTIADISRH